MDAEAQRRSDAAASRRIWHLVEPVHAVVYFLDACRDSLAATGLRGFWMGYFAGRAAPLGPVGPDIVGAAFYNFAPSWVARSVPDAWTYATPAAALDARATGAAVALRQLAPDADELTRRALPLLESAAAAARCGGRVLAAANQALPLRDDPVERLWQATTTLREHRGDGHVAALVAAGIDGLEAHVLASAAAPGAADPTRLQEARGWTPEEWEAAAERLRSRRLVERTPTDTADVATDEGHLVHARIELTTDEISWQPYRDGLTEPGRDLLVTVLRPLAQAVVRSGTLPFPNPIGLPAPPGA